MQMTVNDCMHCCFLHPKATTNLLYLDLLKDDKSKDKHHMKDYGDYFKKNKKEDNKDDQFKSDLEDSEHCSYITTIFYSLW